MEQSVMLAVSSTVLALLCLCSTAQALTIRVLQGEDALKDYTDPYATYNDRSYNVPSSPIEGILVLPTPSDACRQVNGAPAVPNGTNVFAFVENYCPGQSEIYLEDAGYDAMIAVVLNDNAQLKKKGAIPQALVINKTFATYLKDKAIVNDTSNINPNTTVYVSLYDDSSIKLEELFIVFGVVLLAAMFLSIFVFCCSVCWRVLVVKWRNRGLTRWQVRRLPKRKYRRARDGACETCSICLEEFREGETVRVLPCDHVFHPKCVDVWLQKWNRTCPLCKSAIKRKGKPLFTEDPESSHLLTDSGAPSVHLPDDETDGARGLAAGAAAMGGASNYGATEHSSPLRLVAGGGQHRRSASSASASSRRSSQRGRSVPKQDPTSLTTIELNVTSSEETSRSASHSPTPGPSPSQFHTPHQSDDDEATPSFKTANGENSTSSSVRA